jgi:hypothetical protein
VVKEKTVYLIKKFFPLLAVFLKKILKTRRSNHDHWYLKNRR